MIKNDYIKIDNYYIGYTYKHEPFFIDEEDFDKVKEIRWHINCNGYVTGSRCNKKIRMHRLLLDAKIGEYVDHINHNKSDNRKRNLRKCTNQQNAFNSKIKKNNKSGITGVYWNNKDKRWCAEIKINYKKKYLGASKNIEDVIALRKEAERMYFGEFQCQI